MFGNKKPEPREDDNSFLRRIRAEIEDHSGRTSGIKVFEHSDETTLDEQEREILARLKAAHDKWVAEHGDEPSQPQEDAFKSVKVRV